MTKNTVILAVISSLMILNVGNRVLKINIFVIITMVSLILPFLYFGQKKCLNRLQFLRMI